MAPCDYRYFRHQAQAMAFKPPKWAATPARVNRLARLDVLKAGETVESVALGARGCTVLGRRADVCDYEMAHPSISRQHAALVHDQRGRVTLLDLSSAQGSFLNSREVEPNAPVVLSGTHCLWWWCGGGVVGRLTVSRLCGELGN